jgi:hypothetical protein
MLRAHLWVVEGLFSQSTWVARVLLGWLSRRIQNNKLSFIFLHFVIFPCVLLLCLLCLYCVLGKIFVRV